MPPFAEPISNTGSITGVFQKLRKGETDAAKVLWDRFFPRLRALANKTLAGSRLPMSADDALQEAFFSFFRSVESGKVDEHSRRSDLWKLLCLLTVQLARKQIRGENALKRGRGRTLRESDFLEAQHESLKLDELFADIPTPDADLICEDLVNQLEPDLREAALLRLSGYTNGEIKEILNTPLRAVERRMQLIRAVWIEYTQN